MKRGFLRGGFLLAEAVGFFFPSIVATRRFLSGNSMLPFCRAFNDAGHSFNYVISPITVWTETKRWAASHNEPIVDLNIHGAAANYDKTVKTVADVIFVEEMPSVERFLSDGRPWFGSRFFDALQRLLREEKKAANAVQVIMNIPLSDAKGLWSCLVGE
jgi:hypothetical protein